MYILFFPIALMDCHDHSHHRGMQALRCDAESAAWFSCVEAGYCNWLQLCFFPPSMNSCFVYTLDQCIGNSFHLVISNALIQGVSEN